MEVKRCEKGHFYDAEASSFCPQCAAERAGHSGGAFYGADDFDKGAANYGATEPAGGMEDYGATEPIGGMANYGATEPAAGFGKASSFGNADSYGATENYGGGADPGPTVGVDTSGFTDGNFNPVGPGAVEDYDSVTEPVTIGNVHGFSPVVGWLVCVDGPARGTDYRIRAGYNFIGRAEHMDICVCGDRKIAREKHALLAYDQQERVFFFGPADGKSIVRINGKMVMNPQEIHAYDVLSVGSTQLMFVPLCGERFDWNEE